MEMAKAVSIFFIGWPWENINIYSFTRTEPSSSY
jgi:hypothetical protein